jgi:hypothetical protein
MSGTLSRKHSRVSVRRSMSRLVFIYSSLVSTRARVTIEHHRYWHHGCQTSRPARSGGRKPVRIFGLASRGLNSGMLRRRCSVVRGRMPVVPPAQLPRRGLLVGTGALASFALLSRRSRSQSVGQIVCYPNWTYRVLPPRRLFATLRPVLYKSPPRKSGVG